MSELQSPPQVSVILPTYQRADLLENSIRSVLDQTFENFELIVVDDGSTDATPEVVRGIDDPRIVYLRRDHAGIGATLNAGLRRSTGAYVARNDSDDLWLPDLLDTLVSVLDANPAAGLAYGRAQLMNANGAPTAELRGSTLRYPREPVRSLLYADYTCSITSLYRRSVIAPMGGWDDGLVTSEDWDLALRTARRSGVVFADRVLARVRRHAGNSTNPRSPLLELRVARRRRVLDKVFTGSVPAEISAMKGCAYRNLHVAACLEFLGVRERGRARQAFVRACREGGSTPRAIGRVAVSYATWRWGSRFPGLMRSLGRAAAAYRGQTEGAARTPLPEPARDVTVVVVPRERFSFTRASLEVLIQQTRAPHELVYVDGGSPWFVRRYLRRAARRHGFQLVRSDRRLTPNEARNIGLSQVRTPYVAFIDNDTLVSPGWLTELMRCAKETDAWVCGPLCLIGPLDDLRIHLAGGQAHVEERDGRRVFVDTHDHAGKQLADVREELSRTPTELIEFHCMLVRTGVFTKLGALDEHLMSLFEHEDFCMAVREAGGGVVFEPASVVAYVPPTRLAVTDAPFFLERWSDEHNRESFEHFNTKWRVDEPSAEESSAMRFARAHRRIFMAGTRRFFRRITYGRSRHLGWAVDGAIQRLVTRSRRRAQPSRWRVHPGPTAGVRPILRP